MTTSPLPNKEWAKLLRQSKPLAKKVEYLIYNNLKSHILVQDIVSETLEYAYEHPEQWRNIPEEDLINYLKRIANFLILQKARTRRRHREVFTGGPNSTADVAGTAVMAMTTPSKLAHKGEKSKAVEKILGRISNETQRQALKMVWIEGIPIKEVAQKLDLDQNYLYCVLQRALESCRKIAMRASFEGFRVSGETL